jgi:hypothetical protein
MEFFFFFSVGFFPGYANITRLCINTCQLLALRVTSLGLMNVVSTWFLRTCLPVSASACKMHVSLFACNKVC